MQSAKFEMQNSKSRTALKAELRRSIRKWQFCFCAVGAALRPYPLR